MIIEAEDGVTDVAAVVAGSVVVEEMKMRSTGRVMGARACCGFDLSN
jgi:hypothetical protein